LQPPSEASHEGSFFVRGGRLGAGPELVQTGEIGIHRRGVYNEEPSFDLSAVAKGVSGAARYEEEALRPDGQVLAVYDYRHQPLQYEIRLGAVGMPVRGRSATTRGKGALHDRNVATVLLGQRLEEHHAAAGGELPYRLTAS
jgi:hypothetical protein